MGPRIKYQQLVKAIASKNDPVIEHLKHPSRNQPMNIEREILDQIALEGLTGITLIKLFQVLDALDPRFKCTQDEKIANFVWSILLNRYLNYNVQAFHLNPKTPANSEGRTVTVDKPIKLPSQTLKRFAKKDLSLYPIQEGEIMGSCKNYLDRKDITDEILDSSRKGGSLNSVQSLHVKYGLGKIFLVACQTLRTKAVIPDWADPNIDIKLREYCFLELIGQSRTLGTVFPNDKALGRYRIMLMAKGFITQYQEATSSPIEHHLRRFSTKRLLKKADTSSNKSSSDEETSEHERPLSSYCCDPGKMKADRSILAMVYDVIAESNGLTQLEIRKKLKLPKFHLRNHLKNLVSIEMIYSKIIKSDPDRTGSRIFKTAHKLTKRRRVRDDLVKPTGIMASWDEVDLRAKKIIGHKRSSFSKAEDSLLILCRITSILIEPGLKLSWCVHKRLVRDLLHKELVESHDKTSDACLRRIKYLKRLPNNIMSINELTAELGDDPDIRRLIQPDKPQFSDERLNKLFVQVLKTVRSKIPNLLGISSSAPTKTSSSRPTRMGNQVTDLRLIASGGSTSRVIGSNEFCPIAKEFEIKDHRDLKEKYELIDCQSVASISGSQTYEKAKNVVDVKFNNACLVTMAYTLTYCFQTKEERSKQAGSHLLLDKFYSNYHDKLINSMISKLNKRTLLTRKCAPDRASLYKPRSRMSLKLNQSVLFLLNRYQSHSLIQLAHPISQIYQINLSESNEMASIALLTSLCSLSSFNLHMELRIPPNVVSIDHGNKNLADCLIVKPCNIRFHSDEQLELKMDPLLNAQAHEQESTNWLVKSYRLLDEENYDQQTMASVEYQARLWKTIDGRTHLPTLFKLIEALLSWIIVFPGVERDTLQSEFGHMMPVEHLLELLNLMESLELILSLELEIPKKEPCLFGYKQLDSQQILPVVTYEPSANAYVNYCQLLNYIK